MDLEDSFSERIILRTKARKEYLNEKKMEFSSVCKKRAVVTDEHQGNSDEPPNKSPKWQSVQTVQVEYSPQNKENIKMQHEDSNTPFVPFNSTSKIRGLAALKKNPINGGVDGTNLQLASQSQVNKSSSYVYSTNSNELCSGHRSRLANLAADIRQWEDDTQGPTLSSNNVASIKFHTPSSTNAPNSASQSNTFKMKLFYTNKQTNSGESSNNSFPGSIHSEGGVGTLFAHKQNNFEVVSVGDRCEKLQVWDEAITATLDTSEMQVVKDKTKLCDENGKKSTSDGGSQAYNECSDESINENDFAENYSDIRSDYGSNIKMKLDCSPFKQSKQYPKLKEPMKSIEGEKLPSTVIQNAVKANVDPAELPLSARKALFEEALLGGTPKINENIIDHKLSVAQRAAMFENASRMNGGPKNANFKEPKRITPLNSSKCDKNDKTNCVKNAQFITNTNPKVIKASPVKKIVSPPATSTLSPTKHIGNHTRLIHQKLIENSSASWQEKEIVAKVTEERKQEISSLVNHWEKLSSSSVENSSEAEINHLASEEDFSCDSDAVQETSKHDEESEDITNEVEDYVNDDDGEKDDCLNEDSDMCDVFYSLETENVSLKSVEDEGGSTCQRESSPSSQNTGSIKSSLSYSGISSYTDEDSYNASGSQSSCASGSSLKSYDVTSHVINKETSVNRKEKNTEVPLLYTVSFYRKQKQETRLTPVRTIVRCETGSSPESSNTDYTGLIQEHIKALQEEILRQQIVISQTSQALNLCSATAEFSGSTEQVEGERLLLIATQKRQACLNEISRLKTFGAQGENIADGKGTLTITDLQLPLKREFIVSQLEGKGSDTIHYFLCLIRHGAQVIVTQMMSTDDKATDGTLCFTNHIQLKKLPADFSIIFEVYALQTKKEVLPHEKKYHIKREHSKIRLTPKSRKADNKILLPAISSPGGPNAVRSPSFGVVGFTRFSLQNCNKKTFTLDKVPFTSPLDGVLQVRLQLHAEHDVAVKGFLTMFEDVGGFGSWHRRWCALDANHVAYWKYPDDEQKKEPVGLIDLKQCVTSQVKLVSRDVCARSHTFQLVTVRPQEKGDKNTLICRSINTLTTTKYLLSADTKDERTRWCDKLNEALSNVRKWDPQALRPVEIKQE